jgi:hypothetical protein
VQVAKIKSIHAWPALLANWRRLADDEIISLELKVGDLGPAPSLVARRLQPIFLIETGSFISVVSTRQSTPIKTAVACYSGSTEPSQIPATPLI